MICIHCGEIIDTDDQEFSEGIDLNGNVIYMCEECETYSGRSIAYYENRKNKKRSKK